MAHFYSNLINLPYFLTPKILCCDGVIDTLAQPGLLQPPKPYYFHITKLLLSNTPHFKPIKTTQKCHLLQRNIVTKFHISTYLLPHPSHHKPLTAYFPSSHISQNPISHRPATCYKYLESTLWQPSIFQPEIPYQKPPPLRLQKSQKQQILSPQNISHFSSSEIHNR